MPSVHIVPSTWELLNSSPFHHDELSSGWNPSNNVKCSSIILQWDFHEGSEGDGVSSKHPIRHQGASFSSSSFIDSFTI